MQNHSPWNGQSSALLQDGGQLAVEQLCRGGPGSRGGVAREADLAAMKASHKHIKRT